MHLENRKSVTSIGINLSLIPMHLAKVSKSHWGFKFAELLGPAHFGVISAFGNVP